MVVLYAFAKAVLEWIRIGEGEYIFFSRRRGEVKFVKNDNTNEKMIIKSL